MIDQYFLSICSELSILLIANGRISSLQARGIIFSNVHFTIIKEGMMSAKRVFKMGFLSMIAVTGLFVASQGFATDAHITSNSKEMKSHTGVVAQASEAAGVVQAVSDDLKMPESRASQLRVVDSSGKVYLLTPMQTKDSKAFVGYTMPTSR